MVVLKRKIGMATIMHLRAKRAKLNRLPEHPRISRAGLELFFAAMAAFGALNLLRSIATSSGPGGVLRSPQTQGQWKPGSLGAGSLKSSQYTQKSVASGMLQSQTFRAILSFIILVRF